MHALHSYTTLYRPSRCRCWRARWLGQGMQYIITCSVNEGASAVNLAGYRKYEGDGNVGQEYDAWTNEGLLEYYWGEHIHLGYYSDAERAAGYKKKDFKVRTV